MEHIFLLQVDFPLPIVACNLMIEYADFYENFQVICLNLISVLAFIERRCLTNILLVLLLLLFFRDPGSLSLYSGNTLVSV